MSVEIYRVSCKSEEQRGGGNANIVELGFDTDADAELFASNVQLVLAGTVVSVDKVVSTNYALPYPEGTDSMVRFAMFDGVGQWQNCRITDIKPTFDVETRAGALIAAGVQIWKPQFSVFAVPTVINITEFTPGPSV